MTAPSDRRRAGAGPVERNDDVDRVLREHACGGRRPPSDYGESRRQRIRPGSARKRCAHHQGQQLHCWYHRVLTPLAPDQALAKYGDWRSIAETRRGQPVGYVQSAPTIITLVPCPIDAMIDEAVVLAGVFPGQAR